MLLIGAGSVQRDVRLALALAHEATLKKVRLELFSRDVGEHLAIHFHARTQRLTALLLHLPAESRILDNVFLCVGKVVFGQHGAHTGAPL